MADDIATLGLRVQSQEVDTANQRLGQLPEKAGKAQKATDALAGSSDRASAMLLKHVQAIQQQVGELVKLQQAQLQATTAQTAAAAATTSASAAVQRASTVHVQYSASLTATTQATTANATATKAQAAAQATATAQNERAASSLREVAEAIREQHQAMSGSTGTGASALTPTAQINSNAQAVMNLGKQTAVEAEETRNAAIAHANVAAVLALDSNYTKRAAGDHKELANAMGLTAFQGRMVAIQIPDIVQGLLSGQGVFRTTIQQGGQIVQILGMGPNGFGGALSAVVRFLPMLLGFGAVAALFGTLAAAVLKGREEFAHLNNELAITNGYSGVTANNYESMARRIAAATDTTIGSTKTTISALIDQGQLTGQALTEAAAYSQKFAAMTGEDATKVVASFASMRDGVTAFAIKHVQQYHDLSQAQIDEIARLEEEGKWHQAQLQFFRDANAAMQRHVVQYGYIEAAVHKVGEAASSMWDKLLGLGKPKTLDDQLNDLRGALERNAYGMKLRAMGMPGVAPDMTPAEVASTVDQMARLSFQQDQERAKTHGPLGDIGNPIAAQSQTSAQQAAVDQALAARAQAEAGLTADVVKQADLQKQALRYQTAADQSRLQQQIIDLNLDKSLNDAQRGAIAGAMKRAAGINAQVNADRARLIDVQTQDKLQQQAADLLIAQNGAASSVLQAQESVTTNIQQRALIETTLLNLADQSAIIEQQKVIASAKLGLATEEQAKAAQAQIDAINGAHGYKQQLIDQTALVNAIHQQAGLAQDALQNQSAILQSQQGLAKYGFERDTLDKKILAVEQQIARSKAQEALAAAEAIKDEAAIARARADIAALEKTQANETKASQDTFLQSYDKVSGALSNMSSAFGSHDWVGGTHSLFEAMGSLGNALGPNGLGGALSKIASELGPLGEMIAASIQIGQAGGAAFAKATGGNSQNAKIGGYFGLLGGIIGSFFGESDASIQRRKDQNAAAQAALGPLQTAAQQAQQQEITLAQLTGDKLRVTNLQRQQELNGLDAANRARQQEIYDLQDKADAADSAVQSAVQQMQSIHDAAANAAQSLGAFYASLTAGPSALNSPLRQYMLTKSNLVGVNTRIAAGDQSAFGDVQNSVTAFLQAAQAKAPNKQAYDRDLAFAEQSVRDAKAQADSQVSIAQQQLDAANAQVGGLATVNASVLTVAQAVANLQTALTGQKAVQDQASAALGSSGGALGYTSTNGDFAAYVQQNPDLLRLFQAGSGMARGRSEAEFGMYQWVNYGQYESRSVRPYALGGAFTNSVVSSPTTFDMGLMGEAGPEAIMPLHRGPDGSLGVRTVANDNGWGAVVDRLESIETELRGFRSDARIGQGFLKNIHDLFLRVSRDGDSIQTELKVPA